MRRPVAVSRGKIVASSSVQWGNMPNGRGAGGLNERGQHAMRVVLADDHPLYLEALRTALRDREIDVVGTAGRGDEVVGLVAELAPDAVLLDLEMPGMNGLSCLAELRARWPELKVLILSGHDGSANIERALSSGAACFVAKTADIADVIHALRMVTESRTVHFAPPASALRVVELPEPELEQLTRREREILALTAEGLSNSQLARKLWVTEQTVKFHLSNIYRKLEVANRTQAAARARQLRLIEDVGTQVA
jgi:DNA-binding NarL/FixJ family response regulator